MSDYSILVVDDEPIARENLDFILRKEGHAVRAVDGGKAACQELDRRAFDLVMTDLKMRQIDGMQVLERAKELYPDIEVIILTGYATVATAVEAMQKGAYHYLAKPYSTEEVRVLVRKALEKRQLSLQVQDLKRQLQSQQGIPWLIGKNEKIEALKKTIAQIAPTDCNVLILGETGTGKELVAKAIHHLSPRADRRFLAINCGAFNAELLANELFGHEKEAFTGARGVKHGLLETASGGTIFLDEIGDMPLAMQVKLLRVIQEKTLMRVGGTQEIPVDLRIVAATNKNLTQEVETGAFRQDLYFRLNVITLEVPPLTDRKDDIPLLCQHFMHKFAASQGKAIDAIAPEVLDILLTYEFPGNVRELENIIERAVTLCNSDGIEVRHLASDLKNRRFQISRRKTGNFMTLEENERDYITWIMQQVQGNKTKAAAVLGIDRVSLWRKLKRYDME